MTCVGRKVALAFEPTYASRPPLLISSLRKRPDAEKYPLIKGT